MNGTLDFEAKKGLYQPPGDVWITFMMDDGCTFFKGALKSRVPLTPIIKLGRAKLFFNITPILYG